MARDEDDMQAIARKVNAARREALHRAGQFDTVSRSTFVSGTMDRYYLEPAFRYAPHPGPAIFGPYTKPTRVERLTWWLITSAVHGIERLCNNEPVYRLRMAWHALRRGGF